MDNQRAKELFPLSREELIKRICTLEQELEQVTADARSFLMEHVTMHLLAERLAPSETTRNYQTQARDVFTGNVFFVACLQLNEELLDWNGARQAAHGPGIYRHLRRIICEEKALDLYPAMMYDKMVCIVNTTNKDRSPLDIERLLLATFDRINTQMLNEHGKTAKISVSGYHDSIYELPSAYRQSLRLVEHRRAYGDDGREILFYDDVLTSTLDFESVVSSSDRQSLPHLVKRAIEAQFKSDMLNISMLANQFHVTASYITRTFKQEFGLRPWEYIQELRINEAKDLMARGRGSGLTLKSIAEKSGFGSSSNMIRIFKHFEGETPGECFRTIAVIDPDMPAPDKKQKP